MRLSLGAGAGAERGPSLGRRLPEANINPGAWHDRGQLTGDVMNPPAGRRGHLCREPKSRPARAPPFVKRSPLAIQADDGPAGSLILHVGAPGSG